MYTDNRPHPRQKRGDPWLQRERWVKREIKARQHREAALAGGGKRECDRRMRQSPFAAFVYKALRAA